MPYYCVRFCIKDEDDNCEVYMCGVDTDKLTGDTTLVDVMYKTRKKFEDKKITIVNSSFKEITNARYKELNSSEFMV